MKILQYVRARLSPLPGWLARRSGAEMRALCSALVLLNAYADYAAGIDVRLGAVYFVPVTLAVWFVGIRFAFFMATASCILWLVGDASSRDGLTAPLINGTIQFALYSFWIVMLERLRILQRILDNRVRERGNALAVEEAERKRLQHDILEISDREQRRIGQDLHDGLCQHLTGTALAGHALAETLATHGRNETAGARRIVDLIEDAIGLARGMAKGMDPVAMGADGLMQALEEFADTTSAVFAVDCRFECPVPVLVPVPATATHLYRIAQEAVSNAIKHGHAAGIVILLEDSETATRLVVRDDGIGFAAATAGAGMGLRIMADRAKMIGGRFRIERMAQGGTQLSCVLGRVAAIKERAS